MRTRILRLTATAGATALLVGVGALATAGSASAATSTKTGVVATHHRCDECCRDMCHDWDRHDYDHEGLLTEVLEGLL